MRFLRFLWSIRPDPQTRILGVTGEVLCVRGSDGRAVLTVDYCGNIGIGGDLRSPSVALAEIDAL